MKNVLLISLILLSFKSFSQQIDEIYVVDATFSANQFFNAECQKDSVDIICKNSTFKVVDSGNEIVKVKIIEGRTCNDFAENGSIYCIRKEVFTIAGSVHLKHPNKIWDNWHGSLGGGILTIPFKGDRQSFKVFPAGEVGGVGGLKLSYNKTGGNIIIGGILGLTSIPLNDLNSVNANEIKTVSGVSVGGGISINVANGFQFGIYYGKDFYNTDNTKYQKDWISFGFGYDFFKFAEDKERGTMPSITAPLN